MSRLHKRSSSILNKYKTYLPKAAAEATFLRDLLAALLDFIDQWHESQKWPHALRPAHPEKSASEFLTR
jgi:hypothetical protein